MRTGIVKLCLAFGMYGGEYGLVCEQAGLAYEAQLSAHFSQY